MSQIIIKSEDPIHGMTTKSFSTRAEAEAYMNQIGLGVPVTEEPAKVAEPEVTPQHEEPAVEGIVVEEAPVKEPAKPVEKPVSKPVVKSKPVAKHSKAKKR